MVFQRKRVAGIFRSQAFLLQTTSNFSKSGFHVVEPNKMKDFHPEALGLERNFRAKVHIPAKRRGYIVWRSQRALCRGGCVVECHESMPSGKCHARITGGDRQLEKGVTFLDKEDFRLQC
mmetsp:Transcript_13813/g.55521  ORF Transcript_13813/g.55521 Transcript_13813/m.55521 type:complete len:120 (-) Transcript_13813:6346-6705(-)